MEEIKLDVQLREEIGSGKIKKIRRGDFIPAVVYGGKKESSSTSIKVSRRSYEHIMRLHHGENVLFHLNVLQGDKKIRDYSAIVKDEQHHPVDEHVLHIDFYRISLTEKIEVQVGIEAKGESVGVKKDGASVEHNLWELDVVCLPTNIPAHITVDITNLKIGDAIHVKDLILPEGVMTKHDPEAVVLSIVPPAQEEVEAPAEEGVATEPEVMKEKPKEKEEAKDGGKEKKPAESKEKKAEDKK